MGGGANEDATRNSSEYTCAIAERSSASRWSRYYSILSWRPLTQSWEVYTEIGQSSSDSTVSRKDKEVNFW